ncbi:hypothetical protein HDU67_005911 [Dinochytrium kinnereticum]|nr:hypothetical protein HDU67_005911 [Dinochytrium kinnereticum]
MSEAARPTTTPDAGVGSSTAVMVSFGVLVFLVVLGIIVSIVMISRRRAREKADLGPSAGFGGANITPGGSDGPYDEGVKRPAAAYGGSNGMDQNTQWEAGNGVSMHTAATTAPYQSSSQRSRNYSQFTSDYDMQSNVNASNNYPPHPVSPSTVNNNYPSSQVGMQGQYGGGQQGQYGGGQSVLNGGYDRSGTPIGGAMPGSVVYPQQQQQQQWNNQSMQSPPPSALMQRMNGTSVMNGQNMGAGSTVGSSLSYAAGPGGYGIDSRSNVNYIRSPGSLDMQYQTGDRSDGEGASLNGSESTHTRNFMKGISSPIAESMGKKHEVIHPYDPVQMDELPLRPGDLVLLKTAYDDGYAYGEVELMDGSSRAGVFPLACLIPAGDVDRAKLHRQSLASLKSYAKPLVSPNNESPEILLMNGKITEEAYLRIRRDRKEKEERQISALKERLARKDLSNGERERLQRRLDELELGI